jgi:deoxyribonuclease V
VASWPASAEELIREQAALAALTPPEWHPGPELGGVGGCFVCFPRAVAVTDSEKDLQGGSPQAGDPAWAGAALVRDGRLAATALVRGQAHGPYQPGLLALREGPILEAAVRALPEPPDVLLVNATGRDHPRRAGLALQLGVVLDLPTIGVTHRPLLAVGAWPRDERAETSPLLLDGEQVGCWLRTRRGRRPLAVNPAWRTGADVAVQVVLASSPGARTPQPLRAARRLAREARAAAAIV